MTQEELIAANEEFRARQMRRWAQEAAGAPERDAASDPLAPENYGPNARSGRRLASVVKPEIPDELAPADRVIAILKPQTSNPTSFDRVVPAQKRSLPASGAGDDITGARCGLDSEAIPVMPDWIWPAHRDG